MQSNEKKFLVLINLRQAKLFERELATCIILGALFHNKLHTIHDKAIAL